MILRNGWVALSLDDAAIVEYVIPPQRSAHQREDLSVRHLWYFPHGLELDTRCPAVDTTLQFCSTGRNGFAGAGVLIHPARAIEPDVVSVSSDERSVFDRTVSYEDSDHVITRGVGDLHRR